MNKSILTAQDVHKSYFDGVERVEVLKGIHLEIIPGERVAIIGPSGSGKSTLLHLLGGLDQPTQGSIDIDAMNWQEMKERKRCQVRNQYLGFVYQFHHLLPEFSALENVAMPLLLSGMTVHAAEQQANEILDRVGLKHRITHKPAHLSGGERQRVAIARALVHQPRCVLADEPTGNLDQTTANKVFDLILDLNVQFNTAFIIVTHDEQLARRMDKVFVLNEGVLSQE